jgi:hypothetical protein
MPRAFKILILMIDQLNGTLFGQEPTALFHASPTRRLVVRSGRIAKNYTPHPFCVPARASGMIVLLPPKFDVKDKVTEGFFAALAAIRDDQWRFNLRELGPP